MNCLNNKSLFKFFEYPQTSHVGAYRIRPNASTYPRGCFQGVCDTPLHGMFADIHFKFSNKVIFYQVPLRLFPVCFSDFIRQIARYPPHKIRKTSSKTIRKLT